MEDACIRPLPVAEWGRQMEGILMVMESTDFSPKNGLNEVGLKSVWMHKPHQDRSLWTVRPEVAAGDYFAELLAFDTTARCLHGFEFKYIPLEFIRIPETVLKRVPRPEGSPCMERVRFDRASYVRLVAQATCGCSRRLRVAGFKKLGEGRCPS